MGAVDSFVDVASGAAARRDADANTLASTAIGPLINAFAGNNADTALALLVQRSLNPNPPQAYAEARPAGSIFSAAQPDGAF